ncbi:MAG: ABC transporter ATP-binding protein [Spirochaetes bacterium GWD1_61_31]|nr:MAG: ABC transporter ATP-binding protein [Spirochaetes bacterium GWB1_60_80]OHD33600.1 MAG: ABC transporter ATP-binding protein [Spirochaetes bacterium GWC1_61_12]OHD38523.1 MAG: ABC transporter ATP-binding protein [Spirochaetes bacterium GWD1_61_31]OHD43041.1 MAG: ABC transporter ATP-binding protein [Spirochaetes bacterium GWE1_60_18]OHD59636.1 MAG: ABC transporter ATP-binding protein [Spirochaetes bacterium GWF1_60_12]HAW87250.1 ABC transporter ATP-binding protein [Spirochaetaceae bacteri
MLECRDVTVRFGGLTAVKRMNLKVAQGTIHSLIGPNGAGKTTLFNAITRLVTAQEGDVMLDGVSILNQRPEGIIRHGMVRTFQNLQLSPFQSVRDNIMAGLMHRWPEGAWSAILGRHRAFMTEAEERVRAAAELFGIQNRLGSTVAGLPYGILKKVELARAMAAEPRLLLLDEPAAGLNNEETAELDEILMTLKARGLTVLLVEHDMSLVMRISDAVTVMNFGQLIADGQPAQIARDPDVIRVYLGGDYGA